MVVSSCISLYCIAYCLFIKELTYYNYCVHEDDYEYLNTLLMFLYLNISCFIFESEPNTPLEYVYYVQPTRK